MKKKINFIVALILGITFISRAQDIPIQVINSSGGGGAVGATGYDAYYNIGETVIATTVGGSTFVTQGFLQPCLLGKFGLMSQAANNDVSCLGKTDGFISITNTLTGISTAAQGQVTYMYYWYPSTVCPTNDCATVRDLVPGTYSVLVVTNNGTLTVPSDSVKIENIVINDNTAPCLINVFNGMTPNGDGKNDFLFIENIDQYPNAEVDIYNRWGQHLYHATGYNNIDKKWNGTLGNSDALAPTGTYFYVISLGGGNGKPIKGWIELLHE